jgi:hypothetical protein
MNDDLLKRRARFAEEQVRAGKRAIAEQRQLIAELFNEDHDCAYAEALLAKFLEIQAIFVNDRDRLSLALEKGSSQHITKRLPGDREAGG